MSQTRQDEGCIVRTFGVTPPGKSIIPPQSQEWAQLIYANDGLLTITTTHGVWFVPRLRAVWVPAGIAYRLDWNGAVRLRSVYLRQDICTGLPRHCVTIEVTPLLREIILEVVKRSVLDRNFGTDANLAAVLLDQIAIARDSELLLPMPADARALRVAHRLQSDPASNLSLEQWSRRTGASQRTLERLFYQETGFGFRQWRLRLRVLHALSLLAGGTPVGDVAVQSGYESASAFVAAFRRELGTTPRQYFAGR